MIKRKVRKVSKANNGYEEMLQIIVQQGQRLESFAQRVDSQERNTNQILASLSEHTRVLNEHTAILKQILEGQQKVILGFHTSGQEEKK